MPKISALDPLQVIDPLDEVVILDKSGQSTKRATIQQLTGYPSFGWVATLETWTVTSWDATTRIAVFAVPAGATTRYTAGQRILITQATGGSKYGIIHIVAGSALTVFFPIGTTVNVEAVLTSFYSPLDTPQGFPRDRELWRIRYATNIGNTGNTPAKSAWYKPVSAAQVILGPGKWSAGYRVSARGAGNSSSWMTQRTSLSTSTTAETLVESSVNTGGDTPTNGLLVFNSLHAASDISLDYTAAQTTLHLIHFVEPQGTVQGSCGFSGNIYIDVYSAYIK